MGLCSALGALGLDDFFPKFLKLGVGRLAEVVELKLPEDLEEIGLTRLQARRLEAAAKKNISLPSSPLAMLTDGAPDDPHTKSVGSKRITSCVSRSARSLSCDGSRRRSLSRVSFASVSSNEGHEF